MLVQHVLFVSLFPSQSVHFASEECSMLLISWDIVLFSSQLVLLNCHTAVCVKLNVEPTMGESFEFVRSSHMSHHVSSKLSESFKHFQTFSKPELPLHLSIFSSSSTSGLKHRAAAISAPKSNRETIWSRTTRVMSSGPSDQVLLHDGHNQQVVPGRISTGSWCRNHKVLIEMF